MTAKGEEGYLAVPRIIPGAARFLRGVPAGLFSQQDENQAGAHVWSTLPIGFPVVHHS